MPRSLTEYEQLARPIFLISPVDGTVAQFDSVAKSTLVFLNLVHSKVHQGVTFQSSFKTPDGSPLADDANLDILMVVGDLIPHLTFRPQCGADAEILLYELTTVSSNGTRLADANMDRNSGNGPAMATYHTPTVTTVGNLLYNEFLPGGTGGNSQGGTVREDTERELRVGTINLLRLTNRGGNAQPASEVVQWYETET